jgi:cytochrome c oxidase cbb3-type subunit II
MNRLERFSTIFLIAGLVFFLMALLALGIAPALMTSGIPEDGGMPKEIPDEFKVYYKDINEYHEALFLGRDIYVKEACWHCHSQYVRPVGSESMYYGAVSTPGEYENLLNRPQLFGTRRVGPDLTREAGKRTNDWHFAHLYDPKATTPGSVMPGYTWYFDTSKNPPAPKKEAIALVAYLQSLGDWVKNSNRSIHDLNEVTMPPLKED